MIAADRVRWKNVFPTVQQGTGGIVDKDEALEPEVTEAA